MKLKVTNMKTGKCWVEENIAHSWSEFALELCKADKYCGLVYCDIEFIGKNKANKWVVFDECDNSYDVPDAYTIEVVR